MTDDEGLGVRADRARKRRMVLFMIAYAVVASAFVAFMLLTRQPRPDGSADYPPNVALAAAALFPVLFGGAMVIIWRMLDEVAHRVVLAAWASAFLVNAFVTVSWSMLSQGGWTSPPDAMVMLMVSAVVVVVAALAKERI